MKVSPVEGKTRNMALVPGSLGVPPRSPATLFGRSASAIDMRVPQDVTFTGGFLSNHEFLAGDRVHFVAGQMGTSFLLVHAEAQTGKWDSIWPVFQGMIESISPGQSAVTWPSRHEQPIFAPKSRDY